ncbi:MAG: cupin protein [Planctomycetaceae bacterium]|nr:cupin protein [Planctomycetaceae bacterium]
MVLEGQTQLSVWNEERILGPGELYVIPGGVVHKVVALNNFVKALDFFHPVRELYL